MSPLTFRRDGFHHILVLGNLSRSHFLIEMLSFPLLFVFYQLLLFLFDNAKVAYKNCRHKKARKALIVTQK